MSARQERNQITNRNETVSLQSNALVAEPRPRTPGDRILFRRMASWSGVRLKHTRVKEGKTPEHYLDDHEIAITLDGSFTAWLLDANGTKRVGRGTPGSTSIIPAGQLCATQADEEIEYVAITLSPELFGRAAEDAGLKGRIEVAEACDARDPFIHRVGLALMREGESNQPAGRLYAESLANLLVVHLLRNYSTGKVVDISGGLSGHRLRRAMAFIQDNLERNVGLEEIANEVDLSPFHFARAFKHSVGQTPHQYLTNARIERAKTLLSGSDLSIVDIGLATGFRSQSHFTTSFRRISSMTPASYRNITRKYPARRSPQES